MEKVLKILWSDKERLIEDYGNHPIEEIRGTVVNGTYEPSPFTIYRMTITTND